MNWLFDLISNPLLLTGLSSWFTAQVLKLLIHAAVNRRLEWERLFGDGGMPSGHSATVTSVAVFSGLHYGTGSFEFALCALLAVIVCHDAMGVRLETGRQAMAINRLLESLQQLSQNGDSQKKLKEFVGHTPIQVLSGTALGAVNAWIWYSLLNS